MSLADFLLARIAEDEAAAGLAQPGRHRWSRDRILAECEARRRIVEEFAQVHADYQVARTPTLEGQRFGLLKAVAFLALPYASHPNYREEWKP